MTTINIATAKGIKSVSGRKVNLDVGGETVAFLIHRDGGDTALTHIPTGYRFAYLDGLKLQLAIQANTAGLKLTDRAAAQLKVEQVVEQVGIDKVRSAIAAQPVING